MFVLSNFFTACAVIVGLALNVLYWIILFRALISWVNPDPFNPIVQFLHRVTEPILEPIRRILPPLGIDLSPLIAFFIIIFAQKFLVATLYDLAARFQ